MFPTVKQKILQMQKSTPRNYLRNLEATTAGPHSRQGCRMAGQLEAPGFGRSAPEAAHVPAASKAITCKRALSGSIALPWLWLCKQRIMIMAGVVHAAHHHPNANKHFSEKIPTQYHLVLELLLRDGFLQGSAKSRMTIKPCLPLVELQAHVLCPRSADRCTHTHTIHTLYKADE